MRAIILGGGLCGLYTAYRLVQRRGSDLTALTVLEKEPELGGLCRSFDCEGIHFDLGSHRLHPAIRPEILNDLTSLLGNDLLRRPRRGRISYAGTFSGFSPGCQEPSDKLSPRISASGSFGTQCRGLSSQKRISERHLRQSCWR